MVGAPPPFRIMYGRNCGCSSVIQGDSSDSDT